MFASRRKSEDGIRKAAIFVASLDRAAAEAVLETLGPQQARQVRQTIVAMDEISTEEQERILNEFAQLSPAQAESNSSGVELAGRLAAEIDMPSSFYRRESASQESAERETAGRPFRRLQDAESEKLARLLSGERPQTIALVLSHLPPRQAGGVLVQFPAEMQVEVMRRLVDLEETDSAILREVEKTLEAKLSRQVQMQRRRVAGMDALSGILEESSNEVSSEILDNLSVRDRKLAQELGPPPLAFEELNDLDTALLTASFRTVEPAWIMPALLGAPPEFIERVLGGLPIGLAREIQEKLQNPGPIRLSDIETARARIAEAAQKYLFARKRARAQAA
jgi:flagellar motor switch protein FliG